MTATLQLAIALCESEGYSVIPKAKWVTPVSIARELKMSGSWLHKLLHRMDCPDFDAERGQSKRIIKLRYTPELRRWLEEKKN